MIWKKYLIKIDINRNFNSLIISTNKWEPIWEILQSNYSDENFMTTSHLYNVIEEKYRWEWYWKIMYYLYSELSKVDSTFFHPATEYTNVVSMIDFYTKNWFRVKSKLISWNEELINSYDLEIYNKIKKDYLSWLKEVKLPYTIILEKK